MIKRLRRGLRNVSRERDKILKLEEQLDKALKRNHVLKRSNDKHKSDKAKLKKLLNSDLYEVNVKLQFRIDDLTDKKKILYQKIYELKQEIKRLSPKDEDGKINRVA